MREEINNKKYEEHVNMIADSYIAEVRKSFIKNNGYSIDLKRLTTMETIAKNSFINAAYNKQLIKLILETFKD